MSDNHVCSFCNEDLRGKQHIKIVFENWPVEEKIIYRIKGKERKRTKKITKEVITCFGMECLQNPERWKQFDIAPEKVEGFLGALLSVGKNPSFDIAPGSDEFICVANACHQRTGRRCDRIGISFSSEIQGLGKLWCSVGHPGQVYFKPNSLPIAEQIKELRFTIMDNLRFYRPDNFIRTMKQYLRMGPWGWMFLFYALAWPILMPIVAVSRAYQRAKLTLSLR